MATSTQSISTNAQGAVLAGGKAAPEQVQACDFRTVGGIDKTRLSPLIAATEAFTRGLSQALQARLGLPCEVAVQSSEQKPCRSFLEKAGGSYVVSLKIGPQSETALLQIDPMLLFPVVDRLLGGSGGPSELSREVTDIEDQIAKVFVRLICQELQVAWQCFDVEVSLGSRQQPTVSQTKFSASDSGMVFSCSVNMETAGGAFHLLLPIGSLGAFLGAHTGAVEEESQIASMGAMLTSKALDWRFDLELALVGARVQATDLLNLKVGKVLQLGVSVRTPGVLRIGGKDAFRAVPVRKGRYRGAQLLDRLRQSQVETEK
jgi:flagellar motor switch protein FliM